MGVKVEDDDEDFELEPRKLGQNELLFTQNNMDIDKNTGEFIDDERDPFNIEDIDKVDD